MTVSSVVSRWEYTGNASTTNFAYTNKIFSDSDLEVYLDGVLQTLTTHYTVSGAGVSSGGNVTFLAAPGAGIAVLLVRSVARAQEIDYVENDRFPAETTEDGLDRAMIVAQEQDTALARCLGIADTDVFGAGGDLKIPVLSFRKGAVLGFDATTGDPEAVSVSGFGALPAPATLGALDMLRVNTGQDAYEGRAPAQVAADMSVLFTNLDVDQGSADGQIFRLANSGNVAHGWVSNGATEEWLTIQQKSGGIGGVQLNAIMENTNASPVMLTQIIGGQAATTRGTEARGLWELDIFETDGAGSKANVTADGVIATMRAYRGGVTETVWWLDEDGDAAYSGALTLGSLLAGNAQALDIHGSDTTAAGANSIAEAESKAVFRMKAHTDANNALWLGAMITNSQPYIQSKVVGGAADNLNLNPFGGNVEINSDVQGIFRWGVSAATPDVLADDFVIQSATAGAFGASILGAATEDSYLMIGNASDVDFFNIRAQQGGGATYIKMGTTNLIQLTTGQITLNFAGGDTDTNIRGIANDNLVYVDAANDRVGFGIALPEKLVHIEGDLHVQGQLDWLSTGTDTHATEEVRTTTGVTSTPTTIAGHEGGAGSVMVFVDGYDEADAANTQFAEAFILKVAASTTAGVFGTSVRGSPATRAYTRSGNNIQCAMGSGSYTVTCKVISIRNN